HGGNIKVLGVTSSTRLSSMPDVPTMAEAGFPSLQLPMFGGLWGPAGMPEEVVQKINRDGNKLLNTPSFVNALLQAGLLPADKGSTDDFRSLVKTDLERWTKIIKDAGIKAE